MRWVTWVAWAALCSASFIACGESERQNGGSSGSAGEETGGSAGENARGGTAGTSAKGGASGSNAAGTAGVGGESGGEAGSGAGGSSGPGGAGGDGGEGGATRTFFDELWGAYCRQVFTCPIPKNDVIWERLALENEERCLAALRELLGEEPPIYDLIARIEAGTIRLVPENVAACLAEAESCSKQGSARFGVACRAVFEGDVAEGGACDRWEECAGDAYCAHADGCPGECTPFAEPGAPCVDDEECDQGNGYAFCSYEGAEPVCVRMPFGTPAAIQQPCSLRFTPATEFVRCDEGLWCDIGDGNAPMGTCRAPIPVNQACTSSDDVCAGNATCFDGATCLPYELRHEAGTSCDSEVGPGCDAFAGLRCVEGECRRYLDGAEGDDCFASDIFERLSCAHGLYCQRLTETSPEGKCAPFLEVGAPCTSVVQCASGFCDGTCAKNYCDG